MISSSTRENKGHAKIKGFTVILALLLAPADRHSGALQRFVLQKAHPWVRGIPEA